MTDDDPPSCSDSESYGSARDDDSAIQKENFTDCDDSISALPGSSLLKATAEIEVDKGALLDASTASNLTWKSNHTVHMDGDGHESPNDSGDEESVREIDEFDGENSRPMPENVTAKATRDLTGVQSARRLPSSSTSWFKKLTESSADRERRLRDNILIAKQNSSRWGKDINEEDSERVEEDDLPNEDQKECDGTDKRSENDSANNESLRSPSTPTGNEDDTKDEVRQSSLFQQAGDIAFTSVRNVWGNITNSNGRDEPSTEIDVREESSEKRNGDDQKSLVTSTTSNTITTTPHQIGTTLATFLEHTMAKFDPEFWEDPQLQRSQKRIDSIRSKLQACRTTYRNQTRRSERQIEKSIRQQRNFLVRQLNRKVFNFRQNPFAECVHAVYRKEILKVIHGIRPDDESEGSLTLERDEIDEMLDSSNFDYDYVQDSAEQDNESNEDDENEEDKGKDENQLIEHSTLVGLETKVLRAQHNEWMSERQMEMERGYQKRSIGYLYEVIPEIKNEASTCPDKWIEKIEKAKQENAALKVAYEAHLRAQEKLLAIYRQRYTPSESEEAKDSSDGRDDTAEDTFDHTLISPLASPIAPVKRHTAWAQQLQASVRHLFPSNDKAESSHIESKVDDDALEESVSESANANNSRTSPITGGSLSKKKFVLSFGQSPGSDSTMSAIESSVRNGIIANFSAPPLTLEDNENHTVDTLGASIDKNALP